MRVLIAPGAYAGTLTAVEAADAIAVGWRRTAPGDQLVLMPMADGGPGMLDVLARALGGELLAVTVSGPAGGIVPAAVLLVDDVAYVEAAQACGAGLLPPELRDPEQATTYGVGQLVAAALAAGARRIVIGAQGTATNDGGAGLLAGLGAGSIPPGALTGGPRALGALSAVDLRPARDRVGDALLVVATDVDQPLLGLRGTTNVNGPGLGLARDRLVVVDGWLSRLAHLIDPDVAARTGAGAGGGLGYAALLLGGRCAPGVGTVAEAVGLPSAAAGVDLVLGGTGSLDVTALDVAALDVTALDVAALDVAALSGTVVSGVAQVARGHGRPYVVLAGAVHLGSRELRTQGIEAAYGVADLVGSQRALASPSDALAELAQRVARTWSRAA